jgi:hypothetical protein
MLRVTAAIEWGRQRSKKQDFSRHSLEYGSRKNQIDCCQPLMKGLALLGASL